MADRKFQIEVSTSFNPAGAQQATAALGEVTKSTGKLGEAMGESAKQAEHSGLSHRALHQILHLIARESGPAAGAAVAGVGAAAGGGMLIAIMAAKELFEWLHKIKEKSEEAADVWVKQQEAAEAADQSVADFNRTLERSVDVQRELNNELENQKAVLEAQIEGRKKYLDLLEQEQLAAAGDDKEKQEAVKSRFDEIKRGNDIAAETAKLRQMEDVHGVRSQRQGQLDDSAADAKITHANALANPGASELKSLVESQDPNKLRAAYDRTVKGIDSETEMQIRNIRFNGQTNGESPDQTNAAIEQVKADAEDRKRNDKDVQAFDAYQNEKAALDEHNKKLAELKEKLDQAVKARDENTKALQDETAAITKGQAVLDQHKKDSAQQNAFSVVDRAGGFANADQIIDRGTAAVEAYQHGQKLSQQQVQEIAAMRALFETVGGNSVAIINMIKQSLIAHKTHEQEIAILKKGFATLKSAQVKGSPTAQ